jgi:ribosomal protein S18 acetylase RimI-like enzyme
VHIQATTRQSYRQAARLLARAFLAEPVSQRVYRCLTPAQLLKNLTLDFTGELAVCLRRGQPLELHQNGAIVAAAVLYPPGAYPLPWLAELQVTLTSIFGHARYDLRAWQDWLDEVEKHHPHTPHYYLEYLGVEPAFQGQGLGSHLLSELARRADAAHVGCYLETATERNLPLYQRFGFQVTAQKEIIGLPAWFLWRPTH